MKTCPNCHEEVEDNFDLCWNCNYSFSDGAVVDIEVNEDENGHRKLNCLRCVDVKWFTPEFTVFTKEPILVSGVI